MIFGGNPMPRINFPDHSQRDHLQQFLPPHHPLGEDPTPEARTPPREPRQPSAQMPETWHPAAVAR